MSRTRLSLCRGPTRLTCSLNRTASCPLLFLSDIVEELDAARDAGMQTLLLDRREDYPDARTAEATHGHRRVASFAEIGALEMTG